MLYAAIGVGISGVLFFGIHSMARPPPRTMTKEWQEATNEYLRVRHASKCHSARTVVLTMSRLRNPIQSTVSAVKATRAKGLYSQNLRRHRASVLSRMNRLFRGNVFLCILQETQFRGDHCSYHTNGGSPFCVHMHCNCSLPRPLDKKASTFSITKQGFPIVLARRVDNL